MTRYIIYAFLGGIIIFFIYNYHSLLQENAQLELEKDSLIKGIEQQKRELEVAKEYQKKALENLQKKEEARVELEKELGAQEKALENLKEGGGENDFTIFKF